MKELIAEILRQNYSLKGTLEEMVAYQDYNFLLQTSEKKKYVVKITGNSGESAFVKAQQKVFSVLTSPAISKPIQNQTGETINFIKLNDNLHPLRVFPFIDGQFLAECNPNIGFYKEFGKELGQLDKEVRTITDANLLIQTHEWDLSRFQELKSKADYIKDPEIHRLVRFFFMRHKELVEPLYHLLPKGLIHGDANDWNVIVAQSNRHPAPQLVRDDNHRHPELVSGSLGTGNYTLKGLIDFGDMVCNARINELAIALAYALMGKENKLEIVSAMVSGYHSQFTLSPQELSVLYYQIAARLSTTIVNAAAKADEKPDSEYHQVSAQPAIELVKQWITINPLLFENRMLEACGYPPVRQTNQVPSEIKSKIKKRHIGMSNSLSVSYKNPIEMIGSGLQYMYAADGKTYLDCVNNIPHVGHCHPVVVEAGQKQMASLNTNTRYVYDILNTYTEKLLATFPDSLCKVFFVNSGSAATDLAVRLAKTHTGRKNFKVLDHAYHGNTSTAINLSPYKFNRKGGFAKPRQTHITKLNEVLKPVQDDEMEFAAFVAESIPGCAGQVILDKDFMQTEVNAIREAGGIYIADEVQTGFARVGKHYWGFELYDVIPDIVILGKPIANGHPMGAVVCTQEVAESFETGMEFFSSFGGNPVSCEIANAVLDVIEGEGLMKHADEVGGYLLEELSLQLSELRGVKEVRGSGLFLGIELVKDLKTDEPDAESASRIVNMMKERGFLLSTDGPYENVIKFKPPMCFSMENARELVEAIWQCTNAIIG